jgi:hypothetical protein
MVVSSPTSRGTALLPVRCKTALALSLDGRGSLSWEIHLTLLSTAKLAMIYAHILSFIPGSSSQIYSNT